MCGIAGFFAPGRAVDSAVLRTMTRTLSHRGPDDEGFFVDDGAGIALGHRRLAVIDLSPDGRQPMRSDSGRYVITFNGEVYNYERLRAELRGAGVDVRRRSDTAVLLAAIETWGLQQALGRVIGIFAFALWDAHEQVLHLARDHIGVKPLYYGNIAGAFVFGSELRSLTVYPGFRPDIDRDALALLLRYNCIPAPHSVYRNVLKLLPGTGLTVRAAGTTSWQYWSARQAAEAGVRDALDVNDAELIDRLDLLLRDAVGLQMSADVPLGAFLSGGIDSSTVVALMQAQSTGRVRTYSIGFDGDFNEAGYARRVARHLGTDHTELHVTAQDALALVPDLPCYFDEPFADSSQLPTLLIARLARQDVTVSLSGDGGDELFAGYNRHRLADQIWRRLRRVPPQVRAVAARALHAVPHDLIERGARSLAVLRPVHAGSRIGYRLQKFADIVAADGPVQIYQTLVSHWKQPESVVRHAARSGAAAATEDWPALGSFTEQMLYLDLVTYLPDDILTKVDRATMAVGLEARVPLLDHRVVEFAWRIPLHQKLRADSGKWALRQVLYRYVPRALVERPKCGFAVPLGDWLRAPLRDWAESLLTERRLREDGFFEPAPIRRKWQMHLAGQRDWSEHLWDVLMFQAWHERARSHGN